MSPELAEIVRITQAAGDLAQTERNRLQAELKDDGSVVTNADRAVELFLRAQLAEVFRDCRFWGEEFGRDEIGKGGLWLLDPIDGTTNFASGLPLWGVSVARWDGKNLAQGCVVLPDLGSTFCAELGGGAWRNDQPLPRVRPGAPRPDEPISCCPNVAPLVRRERSLGRLRCFGASVVDGTFVVAQQLRGSYGRGESLYDVAAVLTMATEVGLEYAYIDGSALHLPSLVTGTPIHRPWQLMPPLEVPA